MKAVLFTIAIAFTFNTYSQVQNDTKQSLLRKSKSEKTAGSITLGAGAAMFIIGAKVWAKGPIISSGVDSNTVLGEIMMFGGVMAMAASIPLYKSSKINARKAATLTAGTQNLVIPNANRTASQLQPFIGLRINF